MEAATEPQTIHYSHRPRHISRRNRPQMPKRWVKRPTLIETVILSISPDADNSPFDHTFLDPFRTKYWARFRFVVDGEERSTSKAKDSLPNETDAAFVEEVQKDDDSNNQHEQAKASSGEGTGASNRDTPVEGSSEDTSGNSASVEHDAKCH